MRSPEIPEVAVWESTAVCNLRCRHCGLSCGSLPKPRELGTQEAEKAIRALARWGIPEFVISGGEFTMRPDWERLTGLALSAFPSVRIITNGRLGREMIDRLETLPRTGRLAVSVSIDGAAAAHDARRGRGSFAPASELLSARTDIEKTVITTFARDNFEDRFKVLKLCLGWSARIWSVQLCLPAGRMKRGAFLGESLIRELATFVAGAQLVARQFGMDVVPDDCFGFLHPMRSAGPWQGCPADKRLITILADGGITGCPTMGDEATGNILTDSLADVWRTRSERAMERRPRSCDGCDRCSGGCRAVEKLFGRQFCF